MPAFRPDDLRNKPVFDRMGTMLGTVVLPMQDPKTKTVKSAQLKIDTGLRTRYPDITKEIVNLDLNALSIDAVTKKVSIGKPVDELKAAWK